MDTRDLFRLAARWLRAKQQIREAEELVAKNPTRASKVYLSKTCIVRDTVVNIMEAST